MFTLFFALKDSKEGAITAQAYTLGRPYHFPFLSDSDMLELVLSNVWKLHLDVP